MKKLRTVLIVILALYGICCVYAYLTRAQYIPMTFMEKIGFILLVLLIALWLIWTYEQKQEYDEKKYLIITFDRSSHFAHRFTAFCEAHDFYAQDDFIQCAVFKAMDEYEETHPNIEERT